MRYWYRQGITRIWLSIGYGADQVIKTYENGLSSCPDLEIRFIRETKPLGTGGALRLALKNIRSHWVLVGNGDSLLEFRLSALSRRVGSGIAGAIMLRETEPNSRYGAAQVAGGRLVGFREKETQSPSPGRFEQSRTFWINGGVYLLKRRFFESVTPSSGAFSLERDFLEKQASTGRLAAERSHGFFIDIGIPEDYQRAQTEAFFRSNGTL